MAPGLAGADVFPMTRIGSSVTMVLAVTVTGPVMSGSLMTAVLRTMPLNVWDTLTLKLTTTVESNPTSPAHVNVPVSKVGVEPSLACASSL